MMSQLFSRESVRAELADALTHKSRIEDSRIRAGDFMLLSFGLSFSRGSSKPLLAQCKGGAGQQPRGPTGSVGHVFAQLVEPDGGFGIAWCPPISARRERSTRAD